MGIILVTKNNSGIYNRIGTREILSWENCKLAFQDTGEIISNSIRPRFSNLDYDAYYLQYKNAIANGEIPPTRFLKVMTAYEPDVYEEGTSEIAETKYDGHRCLLFIGKDANRAFSRRISDVTGWFSENSDQIPHIRDLDLSEFEGTVLDGEIVWGENSSSTAGVMGALPETAIHNQYLKGWADYYVFDILYYKGVNIQRMPLYKRKAYIHNIVYKIRETLFFPHIEMAELYVSDMSAKEVFNYLDPDNPYIKRVTSYGALFKTFIDIGKEGIIIKDIHGMYEQGKKSKAMLKMKGKRTWDVVIVGLTEPTKEYSGKLLGTDMKQWEYWEDRKGHIYTTHPGDTTVKGCIPVTKPYAMGWCGGIRCGVWMLATKEDHYAPIPEYCKAVIGNKLYILREVAVAKGLSEDVMEDLRKNIDFYVKNNRVLALQGQQLIDKEKGTIRHPRFFSWRDDKNHAECTWDVHIS